MPVGTSMLQCAWKVKQTLVTPDQMLSILSVVTQASVVEKDRTAH